MLAVSALLLLERFLPQSPGLQGRCECACGLYRRLFPDQKPYRPPVSIPTQSAAAGATAQQQQFQQQQQQQQGNQVVVEPSSEALGQQQSSAGCVKLGEDEKAVQYRDLQPADILLSHVQQLSTGPSQSSFSQPADPRLRKQQEQQQAEEQIRFAAEAQAPLDPRLRQDAGVSTAAQTQPAVAAHQVEGHSDPRLNYPQEQHMVSAEGQPQPAADLQSTQGQGQTDPRLRRLQQQHGSTVAGQQGTSPGAPAAQAQPDARLQQQQLQPPGLVADPRLPQPHQATSQAAAVQLQAPAGPPAGPPAVTDPRLRPNQAPVDPCVQPQRPSPVTLQPCCASSGTALTAEHGNSGPPCLEQIPVDYGPTGSAAAHSDSGQAPADPRIQRQLPSPITLQPPTSALGGSCAQSSWGQDKGPPPITLPPPTSSAGPHSSTARGPAPPPITLRPPTTSGGAHSSAGRVSRPVPITLQPPSSVGSTSGSAHALPGPPPITLQPPRNLPGPPEAGGNGPGARPQLVTLRPPPMHAVAGAVHSAPEGSDMRQSGSALHRNANGAEPHGRCSFPWYPILICPLVYSPLLIPFPWTLFSHSISRTIAAPAVSLRVP